MQDSSTTSNAVQTQKIGVDAAGKSGGSPIPYAVIGQSARAGLNMIGSATGLITQEPDEGDAIANTASDLAGQFGPWGLLAAGVIDSFNFLDKALGKKVKGFEGNTGLSGYQDFSAKNQQFRLTTQNSANRYKKEISDNKNMFAKAQTNAISQKQMNQANLQAGDQTAMRTQNRLNDINSNKSLLAKEGSKLENLKEFKKTFDINKFKKGGVIELTSTPNVIPEGALHSRLNNLDDSDTITKKGIPVVTVDEDTNTGISILKEGNNITQHAEIERDEIIFNKELTIKLEKFKKEYDESPKKEKNKIALECGKILAAEILNNTEDNTDLIIKLQEDEIKN